MIYALERIIRWLQPKSHANTCHSGQKLLLIQIDGLGYTALQQALAKHKMPYLAQLLRSQGYCLQPIYSGLPSSTPAVQGELFYGIEQSVPAFGFLPPHSRKPTHLLNTQTAQQLQQYLQAQCPSPLLQQGSSYCNLFTGGAPQPHFCVADFRWNSGFNGQQLKRALVFCLFNLPALLRTMGLALVECALALYDALRGSSRLTHLPQEWGFIPSRVAISIILRELTTLGVQMDIAKGLPIIHANFLGYDEHAHRRGPRSAFAYWSLKGIDYALKRLDQAARHSPHGPYHVWIYSDHGQEAAQAYTQATGKTLQERLNRVYQALTTPSTTPHGTPSAWPTLSEHLARAQLLSAHFWPFKWAKAAKNEVKSAPCLAVAFGPLGFIYPPKPLTDPLLLALAQGLVKEAQVPWVFIRTQGAKQLSAPFTALNASGQYLFPQQAAAFLGADHPYLAQACKDFIALCQHPLAGPITISGWQPKGTPLTFGTENGAHGGPGRHECQGFLAIPSQDQHHFPQSPTPLRPKSLRLAAQSVLKAERPTQMPAADCLRIITYNIHAALGMDGQRSYPRIAQVIRQWCPHIVALQEVWAPTASPSPISIISKALNMTGHFHPLHIRQQAPFGLAVFSTLPLSPLHCGHYPRPRHIIPRQQRGFQWLSGQWQGQGFHFFNTHFGLSLKEQRLQTQHLLSSQCLGQCQGPVIICGDFNATPWHFAHQQLTQTLLDAQQQAPQATPCNTFFSRWPSLRLDHIFISPHWQVQHTQVPHTPLTQVASDHLPLVVDLKPRAVY